MKGSRFIDGVHTSQDNLTNIDDSKTEAIKERFGSITGYGVVPDSASSPFNITTTASTIAISPGECYTEFTKDDTDVGYAGTGERIYLATSNTVDRKNSLVAAYIYLVYVELHTNRKTDDLNIQHYTKKLDSFIVGQLTLSEKSALATTPYSTVITGVHVTNTDITGLSDNELNDTFGSGNWEVLVDELYVNITVTNYNSVYLGRVLAGAGVVDDLDSRAMLFINSSLIDTTTIANLVSSDIGLHRKNQHSTGIIGSRDALKCTIDSTPDGQDVVNITDLAVGEYAYVNGAKLENSVLSATDKAIQGTPLTAATTYYIYIKYTTLTGIFSTGASISYPINTATEYYMVLCSIYKNTSDQLLAFNNDPRYVSSTETTNPVTDLRIFGTLEPDKISNVTQSEFLGDSLVSNGNFEEGYYIEGSSSHFPRHWNVANALLNNTSLGGEHSLVLSTSLAVAVSNPIPYDKNAVYSLSINAKTASSTSTLHVCLRGYTDRDITDTNYNEFGSTPQYNVAYNTTIPINSSVNTTWTTLKGDFISSNWTYLSGMAIDNIKYIRVVIKNTTGTAVYVDNVKLIDKNGVTATATELNILDGATLSTAELNILDGITANVTASNLNLLTDTNVISTLHKHNLVRGAADVTATATEVNRLSGITANVTAANLNILTGGTSTTLHSHAAAAAEFASGTTIVFCQASAPIGWTKQMSYNDKALRVVNGSGGGVGGTHGLSSPPSTSHNHTFSDSHTLSAAEMPSHNHSMLMGQGNFYGDYIAGRITAGQISPYSTYTYTGATGSGSSFTINGTTSSNSPTAFAPAYQDVIVCTKS